MDPACSLILPLNRDSGDQQNRQRAHDDDPQREQAYRQANEESTKRQDAERAARSGEDVPGEAASSATGSLAAELRAAKKAAKLEREGEGQE